MKEASEEAKATDALRLKVIYKLLLHFQQLDFEVSEIGRHIESLLEIPTKKSWLKTVYFGLCATHEKINAKKKKLAAQQLESMRRDLAQTVDTQRLRVIKEVLTYCRVAGFDISEIERDLKQLMRSSADRKWLQNVLLILWLVNGHMSEQKMEAAALQLGELRSAIKKRLAATSCPEVSKTTDTGLPVVSAEEKTNSLKKTLNALVSMQWFQTSNVSAQPLSDILQRASEMKRSGSEQAKQPSLWQKLKRIVVGVSS